MNLGSLIGQASEHSVFYVDLHRPPWVPVNTCEVVRPLFFFFLDPMSGEPELATFDQAPTDDFEGVTDFELNDINWTGPNPRRVAFGLLTVDWGPPSVINEHYEAFDLDGQQLDLAYATPDAGEQHGLPVEWILVATGRYDLPRLKELATRSAELTGFEPRGEDPLLEVANRDHADTEAMRRPEGMYWRRLYGVEEVQPPIEHYTR